jgi:hypothetical protein
MEHDERALQHREVIGSRIDLCDYCGRAIPPGIGHRISSGQDDPTDDRVACLSCWQSIEAGAIPLEAESTGTLPEPDE